MSEIENAPRELACPKCKRAIKTNLYEMYNRKEVKCSSCGSMYKFDSSAASNLRSAVSNMENAQKKFAEAYQKLMSTADILLKG